MEQRAQQAGQAGADHCALVPFPVFKSEGEPGTIIVVGKKRIKYTQFRLYGTHFLREKSIQ